MKKIIYLFAIIATVFTSCTPLEDLHNEIDAIPDEPNVESFIYTLVDADYTELDLSFGNFGSVDDAKAKLPAFLATKYALYGEGSDATVTFKVYSPKRDEKSLKVYEATNQDYTDAGLRYPNISNEGQMTQLLDHLYPSPANRVLISLTYVERVSGINSTVENGFIYVDGVWEKSMGITDAEYAAMGEPRAQFSDEDEALVKLPIFLKNKLQYEAPIAGDIQGVMYKLYVTDDQDIDNDGNTNDRAVYSFVVFYIYDGVNWSKYNNVIDSTIKFGNDGTNWVPDNTIRHTLTDADYVYIGTEFAAVPDYVDPAASVNQYKNFDRRSGEAAYWSDDMLLVAMNKLLDNNDPNAVEGQQYVLTFDIYDGSSGTEDLKLIKTNDAWVVNN